jgi:Domain of unknown function (DUF4864)
MTHPVFHSVSWFLRSLAALSLLLASLTTQAQSLSATDAQRIIATVQAQLDAFAQDDAEKAFSFAAPNIRSLMVNADNFLAVVRNQYRVVYRPASVVFIKPQGQRDNAVLRVQMTDSDGDPWLATYSLERQSNATWRITGCVLTEAAGSMV